MYLEKYNSTGQQLANRLLALNEQARRVTDWRREGRWEMVELKGRQQQEAEGKMQFHTRLMLMGHTLGHASFESLQLEGSYIGNSLYSKNPIAQYSGAQFCVLPTPPQFHFGPTNHTPEFLHKLPAPKVPPFEGVLDSVCSRSVPLSTTWRRGLFRWANVWCWRNSQLPTPACGFIHRFWNLLSTRSSSTPAVSSPVWTSPSSRLFRGRWNSVRKWPNVMLKKLVGSENVSRSAVSDSLWPRGL